VNLEVIDRKKGDIDVKNENLTKKCFLKFSGTQMTWI
jgi:hypothetical protein